MSKAKKRKSCDYCGGKGYHWGESGGGTIDPCMRCNSGSSTEEICNEIWPLKQYGPHESYPDWRPNGWSNSDEEKMRIAMAEKERGYALHWGFKVNESMIARRIDERCGKVAKPYSLTRRRDLKFVDEIQAGSECLTRTQEKAILVAVATTVMMLPPAVVTGVLVLQGGPVYVGICFLIFGATVMGLAGAFEERP